MVGFQGVDYSIFQILNSLAGRSSELDFLLATMASDFLIPVGLGLILFHKWFSGRTDNQMKYNQKLVLISLVNMAIAALLVFILNLWFFRERPFAVHDVTLIFYQPTDSSMPSNFATGTFALVLPMLRVNLQQAALMILMVLTGSLARVCVGIHYPSDILVGFMLAIFAIPITLILVRYTNALQERIFHITRRLIPT